MTNETGFYPKWYEEEAPKRSYRSLFKYGDPKGFKHPNRGLYQLVKEVFAMTDEDFKKPNLNIEPFDVDVPSRLAPIHLKKFTILVGKENVRTDTYSRTRASSKTGKANAPAPGGHSCGRVARVPRTSSTRSRFTPSASACRVASRDVGGRSARMTSSRCRDGTAARVN